ncbi:hypothetical protein [Diaphorobacter sp.]|uniref:hypothetical protein n=1 Tax=Diaphorobacter sp. TaxID=1934310 RepID=UPI0028AF23AC|nr:hypothetical protein [Diaphorobacter sp.]
MIYCDFSESVYNDGKPRGPVTQKHQSEAFATPIVKRGFVMSKISGNSGLSRFCLTVWGMVGTIRKDVRTASDVFLTTMLHPLHSKMQTVALVTPEGAKTMTVITQRNTAPTPSSQDAIPASNLHAVLAAFNAANMAASYVERGNFTAARRKLTQALSAINTLQAEA